MSVQMVLLPVFVLVGLTLALMVGMIGARRKALVSGETKIRDIALGQQNWPVRTTQIGNCYRNQFELPLLFYVLTILAIISKHADLLFVVMAWIFVLTRLAHAFVHCTSNNLRVRGAIFGIGALVLAIMWLIFMVRIMLGLP